MSIRTFAAAMVATIALAAPGFAEIHPRAVPVVSHYLAATGDSASRLKETTQRIVGHLHADGLEGTWEMWLMAPDRWMARYRLGSLRLSEGFDGRQAWRTDLTDKSVTISSAAETEHAREDGWFLNEQWALPDQGGGTIMPGSISFGDRVTFDELKITGPVGDTRRAFLNRKTGLIERWTGVIDQHVYEERIPEYRLMAGRKRPAVTEAPTLLPSDKPIERMTVDSVWANISVDTTRFSPPSRENRTIAWRRARNGCRAAFNYGSKTVMVKVSIDGHAPEDFILDTGASLSLIDRDRAAALGLHAEGDARVQGIAGSGSMQFARVGSIALRGDSSSATLKEFRVALVDISEGAQVITWTRPAGILGADFLSHFVVDLDYDAQTVTLHDPAEYHYTGSGAPVPFELYEGIPAVNLTLDAGCSGKFIIDVGNSFYFTVHGSLVRSCGILRQKRRHEVEVMGGGIGGGFVSTLCRLDSLRIGPYGWDEPVAALALSTKGMIGSKDIAGNIGNRVLERFKCTIDYAHRTLYLEPGRRYRERERVSRFGALFARVGSRVVAGNVLHGSAADDAGLRWYDEIIAVDGKPLDRWTREQVDKMLEAGEVGSVHKITYRRPTENDKTVEVTLKDVL